MSGNLKRLYSSPQGLLVLSFAAMIAFGTILLSLPLVHGRVPVTLIDAFFTSTSAVCVTGLVVVDTSLDFNLCGQLVILALIQAGGLGVMTFAGLSAMLLGHRLSLRSQAVVTDSLFQRDAAGEFKRIFVRILKLALLIEAVGAALLFVFLPTEKSLFHTLYSAVFHSVSAFCNAGFSLYSESFIPWRNNFGLISTIMLLIIFGGIGHFTLSEGWEQLRGRRGEGLNRLSFHSRLVIGVSLALILGGTVGLFFLQGPSQATWFERLWAALFQSVTARTAGFNTVHIASLPLASLFLVVLLMFIGGSPGSCAGGIKTSTAAIWLARLRCRLVGRSDTVLFGRTIPVAIVRRVSVILALALLWNTFGVILLLATEAGSAGMEDVIFEQFSAFGTVGLSTGLTPQLSSAGKLWIILTMFIGRLGPLTLALWMLPTDKERIIYPEAKVMIG